MPNGWNRGGGGGRPPSEVGVGGGPEGGATNRINEEIREPVIHPPPPRERCETPCTQNDGEKCVRTKNHQGEHFCCNGHRWSNQSK